ncbi:MAG: serine/threonine-protein kinase [Coriobacteriia bacterium]
MERPLILDRYRPLEDLARGGFGEVVLAYDTRIQRRVAIKRLPATQGETLNPAGLAEARTAAMLNHANIVTVFEWDTDSDEAFIIMEYVDGASLADLLDERGELDYDEAAAVVEGVASALDFAHDNGVLHLDIKPENVLITRDGRVKVTDFGISALSTAYGHGPAAGGTLGYMPLEQLRDKQVDERTDVWALAALIFELLTDANPFAADSIEGAVFKAEFVEPPLASDFDHALDPRIDDVLTPALSPFPADRYRSVHELASRIAPLLGDPALGRDLLAEAIDEAFELDPASEAVTWSDVGLWDRTRRLGSLISRLTGAGVSGWLAYTGLVILLGASTASYAGAGLIALAGLLAPGLGSVVGLAIFLTAVASQGWSLLALSLGALGALVWWFAGRTGAGFASALAAPLLAFVRCGPAAPLLIGFNITALRAAALSAYAATLTMIVSAASGGRAPYLTIEPGFLQDPLATRVGAGGVRLLLASPAPLAVVLGWALAGAAMSLLCARASRGAAFAGAGLATAGLYTGYIVAELISSAFNSPVTWTGAVLLPHVTASLILVVLVIAAGAPPRAEEE